MSKDYVDRLEEEYNRALRQVRQPGKNPKYWLGVAEGLRWAQVEYLRREAYGAG